MAVEQSADAEERSPCKHLQKEYRVVQAVDDVLNQRRIFVLYGIVQIWRSAPSPARRRLRR